MGFAPANDNEPGRKATGGKGIERTVFWQKGSGRSRKEIVKKSPYFAADIAEFLRLLAVHRVHYLIVGGEAVIYYGHARLTGDIDLFYDRSPENSKLLFEALNEFWGNVIPGIRHSKELRMKNVVAQFGVPPNRIDLMNAVDGVRFGVAWKNRKVDRVSFKGKEFSINYIGLDDLIRNKRKANRTRDEEDIRFLEEVRKLNRG